MFTTWGQLWYDHSCLSYFQAIYKLWQYHLFHSFSSIYFSFDFVSIYLFIDLILAFSLFVGSTKLTKRTLTRSRWSTMSCLKVKERKHSSSPSKMNFVLHVVISNLTNNNCSNLFVKTFNVIFFLVSWKSSSRLDWKGKQTVASFFVLCIKCLLYSTVARKKSLASDHVANTGIRSTRNLSEGLRRMFLLLI